MTDRRLLVLLLTIVVNNWVAVRAQQQRLYQGDDCTLDNGGTGVCKRTNKCPYAIRLIRNGESPQVCAYERHVAFVCCPSINARSRRTFPEGMPKDKVKEAEVQLPPWRPSRLLAQQRRTTPKIIEPSPQPATNKSWSKCREYAKVVAAARTQGEEDDDEDSVSMISVCSATEQIIGGTECQPQEFPHMAALGFGDEPKIAWKCGGSLISENFVLTAAHCLFTRGWGKVKWVQLGDLNMHSKNDYAKPQRVSVGATIAHPGYKQPAIYNDIALLRLTTSVTFNSFVRPACLHTDPIISNISTATAIGWGVTQWANQEMSDDLMKVDLRFHTAQRCNETFKILIETSSKMVNGFDDETMICAGDVENRRDTCVGDSGGPLQQKLGDPFCMFSVLGITSFGSTACGESNSPAIYTRVSYYIPWIESIVWP